MVLIENCQDLYDYMKDALRLLDVDWHKMKQVKVTAKDNKIEFSVDGAAVTYTLERSAS